MTESTSPTPTVWQALDSWAVKLKSWQRAILADAIKSRVLTDAQIGEAYEKFLQDAGLKEKKDEAHITVDVAGRPADVLSKQLRLDKVDSLDGINALPKGAALTFGPALTVIYGRNGAGKSGFARLLANACFSRHKPSILGNIYDETAQPPPTAKFHIAIDGVAQKPLVFSQGSEHPDLRRISFFDITVARQHVSETSPFEFKPSGFDIFPEMARAYAQIGTRLDAEIKLRTRDTKFSESFIGVETGVSKAVASIGAATDLAVIEGLAVYGPTEKARFDEVDKQLIALKSSSQKEVLAALKQAGSDIQLLAGKVAALREGFNSEKAAARNALSKKAKEATDAATAMGSEQFKRAFFNAVGTPEWQAFAKSAHALARKEGEKYASDDDYCLLCERPFDGPSRTHVNALLSYVEGDAQKAAELATVELQKEVILLQKLDINIFPAESRVREHIHRIDPQIEAKLIDFATTIGGSSKRTLDALAARLSIAEVVDTKPTETLLAGLLARINEDVVRLEKEDTTAAILALELERQTLRHREVLTQLLPSIKTHVVDAKWCAQAERAKSALSPRHITEKEKELFGEIIGESYRTLFSKECGHLGCSMPIELQTAGQKGKTVRSLAMKGGHQPDEILSEGEQKAVALADFLTEVTLNPANAGIALDDPVTSQDHERKNLIATRLVNEARKRQVIVFTHDLPFLNQIIFHAEAEGVEFQAHWIDRSSDGSPGQVTLNDVPATSKAYDTVERAKLFLAEAKSGTGTLRHDAIVKGMGALRRTIEETVVKRLFKGVVPRWTDRVIVTGLRKVTWDNALVDEMVDMYEELSTYIEGHSHTDEAMGAPPEIKDLEQNISRVEELIKRARPERSQPKPAATSLAKGSPAKAQ